MGEVRCVVGEVESMGGVEQCEEWRCMVGGVEVCGRSVVGGVEVCGTRGGGECGRGGMDVGGGRMRCGWAV